MTKKHSLILGNLFIFALLIISIIVWIRVFEIYHGRQPGQKGLTVRFLDVGQGDSVLITTPTGKTMLIDGGTMPKEWSAFDAGKTVVIPQIRENGIKKLDIVVATHPDLDHIGGLVSVLKEIPVDKFIDSGTIATTQTYEDLLKTIDSKKIKYEIASRGEINLDPAVKIEILSPISKNFANDPNNNSIVIRMECGNISFLFTGDIGESAEALYVKEYKEKLKSTVLKLAHHGGKNSSSIMFLNCVLPDVVIISCGKNNPFGHPAKETLDRIKKIKSDVYRTDKNGTITIKTDGEKYTVVVTKISDRKLNGGAK